MADFFSGNAREEVLRRGESLGVEEYKRLESLPQRSFRYNAARCGKHAIEAIAHRNPAVAGAHASTAATYALEYMAGIEAKIEGTKAEQV